MRRYVLAATEPFCFYFFILLVSVLTTSATIAGTVSTTIASPNASTNVKARYNSNGMKGGALIRIACNGGRPMKAGDKMLPERVADRAASGAGLSSSTVFRQISFSLPSEEVALSVGVERRPRNSLMLYSR